MRNTKWLAALVGLACLADGTAALAQTTSLETPQKAPVKHRSKAAKPHREPSPAGSIASPAANLNAPSTDFNNVEADTGEPRERRREGSNIHPSIDSSGRPVMGLGF